ncbi:Fur family transcriptional regulator [Knoellia sp. LjRoot47]|uniref:Fur family transcriptional regulator n=1 Tax=Knoellia sp. LjRoot47 TaxID=3342330 RepID=UPI003ECE6ED4
MPTTPLDDVSHVDDEQLLRGAHLRVTKPRLAVLHALRESPHADTGTVLDAVRGRHTTVSHQAVYDCLAALTDAGLVRRLQPTGSVARYELSVGDNHHHAVCRSCGAIADVACATGKAPCLHASDPHGFAVDEAEVIYWGLCPNCQHPEAAADTTSDDTDSDSTATEDEKGRS